MSLDENICCVCKNKISWLERIEFLDDIYHSRCFKCHNCQRILRLGKYVDHNCKPYCHPCYRREFEMSNVGLISPKKRKTKRILIDTADPLQDMKQIDTKHGKLNINLFCEKHNIPSPIKPKMKCGRYIKKRINKYQSEIKQTEETSNCSLNEDFETNLSSNPSIPSVSYETNITQNEEDVNIDSLNELKLYFQFNVQKQFNRLSEKINKEIFDMEQDMMLKIDNLFQFIKNGDTADTLDVTATFENAADLP